MLYPLDVLYAQSGIAPPAARRVAPGRIPSRQARLLVHAEEMTNRLEEHVGDRLVIRVLATMTRGQSYFRRALLAEESTAKPVAMGAVRLRLDALNARTRARILREREPLGRVLRDGRVGAKSTPAVFFRITPNAELMAVFRMVEPRTLYGRQTRLTQGDTRIGDIVEILSMV
jgi:hypothetical protein